MITIMVRKNHARNSKVSSLDAAKDVECTCVRVNMIYNSCVGYETIFRWGGFSEQVLSIEDKHIHCGQIDDQKRN